MENTFIMVKPHAVKRGLVSRVIQRFEEKGLELCAARCVVPTKEILQAHYAHLSSKPFFNDLVNVMMSGKVVAMVWSGINAVAVGRALLGETDPMKAAVGTVRGDYGTTVDMNVAHGSDSVENAKKEIELWFEGVQLCE